VCAEKQTGTSTLTVSHSQTHSSWVKHDTWDRLRLQCRMCASNNAGLSTRSRLCIPVSL